MTFDRETAIAEVQRKEARKFTPLPVHENRRRGESVVSAAATGSGSGVFIHLTRNATQSISSAGELLAWDTAGLNGFAGFSVALPATTIIIPQDGYYNLGIQLGWSSFTEGGTITVQKNGLRVWPPTDDPGLWSTTDGQLFEGTAHSIQCVVGDTLGINVNPDDASAQTLASATLAVYLVDRAANEGLYRELVMSHGPIAYWRLGESSGTNAADETGTHDATYINTPTLGVVGVMRDKSGNTAADFNAAASEYVAGLDWASMDFASGPFTIEAWFNADGLGGGSQIIIEKRNPTIHAQPDDGWELGATISKVLFQDDLGGVVQSGALANDTDYHVVLTSDQTTTLMYLNGVQVDSDTGGLTITANTQIVSIARDSASGSFNFDGTKDEVAIYDRVLTAAEVQEHYIVGGG